MVIGKGFIALLCNSYTLRIPQPAPATEVFTTQHEEVIGFPVSTSQIRALLSDAVKANGHLRAAMSARGYRSGMSALSPEADMLIVGINVRFVPTAELPNSH